MIYPTNSMLLYVVRYFFIRKDYNIGYWGILPYNMTTVKFIGKVSTMGDKLIIVIPKEFHREINPLKGKQVKVVVEEAIS